MEAGFVGSFVGLWFHGDWMDGHGGGGGGGGEANDDWRREEEEDSSKPLTMEIINPIF